MKVKKKKNNRPRGKRWRKIYASRMKNVRRKSTEKKRAKKKAIEKKRREKKRISFLLRKKAESLKPKRGRPKKRGPKKKWKRKPPKKKPGPKKLPPVVYVIIDCCRGKRRKLVGKYRYKDDAVSAFCEYRKELQKNKIFPVATVGKNIIEKAISEYILIEKSEENSVPAWNEYGKLVEQKLDVDGWRIIDKFRYDVEETFWVYGYDNRSDRKDFKWIYNSLISGISVYDFKRVLVFKNKVIFKDDNNDIEMILCKTEYDAVRMYNLLEEMVTKNKIKQIIFIGSFNSWSDERRKLEQEIAELTGWNLKKIRMATNTYYYKNN